MTVCVRRRAISVCGVLATVVAVGCSFSGGAADEAESGVGADAEQCLRVEMAHGGGSVVRRAASIDRRPVQKAFRRRLPQFQCCYDLFVQRDSSDPVSEGRIVVELVVGEDGEIRGADLTEQRGIEMLDYDAEFEYCATEIARSMTFREWGKMSAMTFVGPEKPSSQGAGSADEESEEQTDGYEPGTTMPPDPTKRDLGDGEDRIYYPIAFQAPESGMPNYQQ